MGEGGSGCGGGGWGGGPIGVSEKPRGVGISTRPAARPCRDAQAHAWLWCLAVLIHLVTFVEGTVIPPTASLAWLPAPDPQRPVPQRPCIELLLSCVRRDLLARSFHSVYVQPVQLWGPLRTQAPSLSASPSRGAHGRRLQAPPGTIWPPPPRPLPQRQAGPSPQDSPGAQPRQPPVPAPGSVSARHARRPGMEGWAPASAHPSSPLHQNSSWSASPACRGVCPWVESKRPLVVVVGQRRHTLDGDLGQRTGKAPPSAGV